MISITRAQVPAYLVSSSFYESLCPDDTEEFCVPLANFKASPSISGVDDMAHLLRTLHYWGALNIPHQLTSYLSAGQGVSEFEVVHKLLVDFDSHTKLSDVYRAGQTLRAVQTIHTDHETNCNVQRAVRVLVCALMSESDVVCEHATGVLVESLRTSKCSRECVLVCFNSLSADLQRVTCNANLQSIARLYATVCEGYWSPLCSFPLLLFLLCRPDEQIVKLACGALSSAFSNFMTRKMYTSGFLPRYVQLLLCKNHFIHEAAITAGNSYDNLNCRTRRNFYHRFSSFAVRHFVCGSTDMCMRAVELGVVPAIKILLSRPSSTITAEACTILISIVSEGELQALIDCQIFSEMLRQPTVLNRAHEWTELLSAALYDATHTQVYQLLEQEVLTILCKFLAVDDCNLLGNLLSEITDWLTLGKRFDKRFMTGTIKKLTASGGVDALKMLIMHPNVSIHNRVQVILKLCGIAG